MVVIISMTGKSSFQGQTDLLSGFILTPTIRDLEEVV